MVWVAPSMFLDTNMAVLTSREKTKIQDITKSKKTKSCETESVSLSKS